MVSMRRRGAPRWYPLHAVKHACYAELSCIRVAGRRSDHHSEPVSIVTSGHAEHAWLSTHRTRGQVDGSV
jgi:hypothetical protein